MTNELSGEVCPICQKKALTLRESEDDIPYFGKLAVFSMTCSECNFHKSDVEAVDRKDPIKITLEVTSEKDMNIRVIKSSEAKVKIPYIADITPGEASNGYVTNVEGILDKIAEQVEAAKNASDDSADEKKARKLLKKINRIKWGSEKAKIIIEDPSGNSAIISDKATTTKLK